MTKLNHLMTILKSCIIKSYISTIKPVMPFFHSIRYNVLCQLMSESIVNENNITEIVEEFTININNRKIV